MEPIRERYTIKSSYDSAAKWKRNLANGRSPL
jgi:hypothetical protein